MNPLHFHLHLGTTERGGMFLSFTYGVKYSWGNGHFCPWRHEWHKTVSLFNHQRQRQSNKRLSYQNSHLSINCKNLNGRNYQSHWCCGLDAAYITTLWPWAGLRSRTHMCLENGGPAGMPQNREFHPAPSLVSVSESDSLKHTRTTYFSRFPKSCSCLKTKYQRK